MSSRDNDDVLRRDLERRLKTSRASIESTVSDIKEMAGESVDSVRDALGGIADWRRRAEQDPLTWSLGALAAGLALGYTTGYAHRSSGRAKDQSTLAALAGALVDDASSVGHDVILPRLDANIRALFGFDFKELLAQMAAAAAKERKRVDRGPLLTAEDPLNEDQVDEDQADNNGNGTLNVAHREVVMAARTSKGSKKKSSMGKTRSKSKTAKKSRSLSAKSKGSAKASKKVAAKSKRGAKTSSRSMSGRSMKSKAKNVGMKALAGAMAGAVKAIIPPLEEAAGSGERMAGTDRKSQARRSARSRSERNTEA